MPAPETIIQELRALFKQGATPSKLLRHIIGRFPGESLSAWVLRDYLEKAFCLPMARLIQPGIDYTADNPCFVALNRTLIPEIIQRRQEWDTAQEASSEGVPCWFDGLTSTSPEEARDAASRKTHPRLNTSTWENLSPDEQDALRLQMAGIQTTSERVAILATLVERLQQQVECLERQLDDGSIRTDLRTE
jgi:hypothetical protein